MSAIELVLYAPILMAVTFMVVQFALSYLANEAASSAAREAARVARSEGGTAQALSDGRAKGYQIIDTVSKSLLVNPDVSVTRTPGGDVRAVVTGTAKNSLPFPFITFHIQQTVVGPVEQFTPDTPG